MTLENGFVSGKANVAGMTKPDFMFLGQTSQMFGMPNLGNVVLAGNYADIQRAINWPHDNGCEAQLRPDYKNWISFYAGSLYDPVENAIKNMIAAAKLKSASTALGRIYAQMGLDPATRYTKLYLKYFIR